MAVYLGSQLVNVHGGSSGDSGSGRGGGSAPTLQSKTVTPSESAQTVKPDTGYDGLSQVTVDAISKTFVGSGVTKKAAATYTPSTSDQTIAASTYLSGAQTIKGDSNLVAGNIKSGVSIFGVSGTYTGGGGSSGGNNNVEAYLVTSTSPTVNFKTSSGTIKIWGYGTMKSGYNTTLIAFDGDKYYKNGYYGGPSSTGLSLSVSSSGAISGLPSGLTALNAIITRGI